LTVVLYFSAYGVSALHHRSVARRGDAMSAQVVGAWCRAGACRSGSEHRRRGPREV